MRRPHLGLTLGLILWIGGAFLPIGWGLLVSVPGAFMVGWFGMELWHERAVRREFLEMWGHDESDT